MAEFGYGQMTPWDSGDESTVVAFIVRQMLAQVSTMKLVRVEAVHSSGEAAAAGTVDVLPLVNQVDGNGNATPHGTVHGVPWVRMQGGTGAVICDPKAGDIGLVIVSDRDTTGVRSAKKPANPGSARRFSLADGVYVGSVLAAAPTRWVLFAEDRVEVSAPDKIIAKVATAQVTLTTASAEMAFGAHKVVIDASGIHFTGPTFFDGVVSGPTAGAGLDFGAAPISTAGEVTAGLGVNLGTHVHPLIGPDPDDTGPPVPAV